MLGSPFGDFQVGFGQSWIWLALVGVFRLDLARLILARPWEIFLVWFGKETSHVPINMSRVWLVALIDLLAVDSVD